jgi:putative endopeptidase
MGKIRKNGIIASALICSFLMSQGITVKAAEVQNTNDTNVSSSLRLQDDFYSAVNRPWINSAKIDVGQMSNSSVMEINKTLIEQKKQIIKDLLENEKNYSANSDEKKIINLYKNTLNIEARNKQGIEPLKKIIEEINNIKSLSDIANINSDSKIGNTLIQFAPSVDLKDATKYALYIAPTALSFGNSDDYVKPTENSARIKSLGINYYTTLLTLSGYSTEQAKAKIDNLVKFENMIAPAIKGKEEQSKNNNAIDEQYNVYTLAELDTLAPNLNLKTMMKNNKTDKANKIIVTDPKWLKALNEIYKEENLPLIKDYLEIMNINGSAGFLGEDFEKAATEFNNSYLGSKGEIPREEKAINMVDSVLGNVFGKIYVQRYFSDKTKNDVKDMTNEIIKIYEKRINDLDWMSDTTKKKAIEKLNKINIQIGYPDKWEDYSKLEIRSYEEGGSLWENILNLSKFAEEKSLSHLNESVDKTKFICSPQTINAFYNATSNTVTVPAGILQGEFYNANASKENHLGSIGAIIGHEISHAFDNTGAKFDADGNLNNWWTAEDYKKFEDKTNKFRSFYSQVKLDNGKNVNGDLTVGENVADIGGMACVLDILSQMKNPDYKAFFESNAAMWREIDTKEYGDYLLQNNTHSPNAVRVNTVLAQFDKFYETYGIKENDKLYVKPENRLKIW